MRKQSFTKAFTLVELLVVIAIIAVLIAILLPSFMQAKESTHRAVCASRMHQQGVTYSAYALDHDGYYPPPVVKGHWAFGGMITATSEDAGPALLYAQGYVNEPHIYYCPSVYDYAGISYEKHWRPADPPTRPTSKGLYIGYQYYAGYEAKDSASLDHSRFAGQTVEGDRGDILSMDLIVADYGGWWMSNHIGDNSEPLGFNRLLTDQSVHWVQFKDSIGSWVHTSGLNRFFYY